MRASIRAGIAGAAALALLAAAPSGAGAAEGCAFQDAEATERNREEVERALFCLTNLHRIRNGVPRLFVDTRLAAAARAHSDDMIARGFFDHTNPDGAGPFERAPAFGYPGPAGENIATNNEGSALSLFVQWRDSPGHNQNMLAASYVAAGMGINPLCCPGFGPAPGVTGTQMFGNVAADTDDDGLDYYASSSRCARAKEALIAKREARRRARKKGRLAKARALSVQIRGLKQEVRKRCKEL